MAVTLQSTQAPAPQVPTQTYLLSAAGNPGNAPSASKLAQGDTAALLTKFNTNSTRLDVGQIYGCGGFGIIWGLTISAGAGLLVSVAAGQATILGLTELATASSIAVPDATARIWIYLKQDGTLAFVATSIVPPNASCVLLGMATTAGGAVSAIDSTNVVSFRSGSLWRQTADPVAPTDAPPVNWRGQTQTLGGTWDWDGTAHRQKVDGTKLLMSSTGVQLVAGHTISSYETHALIASLQLTVSSANVQRITCAAQQKVLMPSAAPTYGHQFQVFNDNAVASGINVLLRDAGDAVTLGTITPQTYGMVLPANAAGSPAWPTHASTVAAVPSSN